MLTSGMQSVMSLRGFRYEKMGNNPSCDMASTEDPLISFVRLAEFLQAIFRDAINGSYDHPFFKI